MVRAVSRRGGADKRVAGLLFALAAPGAALAQTPPPPAPVEMVSAAAALAASPKAAITNGILSATLLLPDPDIGFYRGARFDWSGQIASLTLGGQEYYGLWFDKIAANVRDYVFHAGEVVVGPHTAALGPAEAFDPTEIPSFTAAAPGQGFLKIGVGVLRKPTDGAAYSPFRSYDVIDGGLWVSRARPDRVEFTHTLSNRETGFGYIYRKTVRLAAGRPEMVIEHSLTNTGAARLVTTTFNHNFLTFGGAPTGPGLTVETPFVMSPLRPPRGEAAVMAGNRLIYSRALPDQESYFAQIAGFGSTAADNRFIVSHPTGASVTTVGDRPLAAFTVWSIRPTVSPEPFITLSPAPGETVTWRHTYTYVAPGGR